MTTEPDYANVQRLFEKMNAALEGQKTIDALAAAQDLYCAMICIASTDRSEALSAAREMSEDVVTTIEKNFDWYRSTARSVEVA